MKAKSTHDSSILESNLNIAYTFAFVNSYVPIVLFLATSDMLRLVRFDGFLDIWLIFASPEKFLIRINQPYLPFIDKFVLNLFLKLNYNQNLLEKIKNCTTYSPGSL